MTRVTDSYALDGVLVFDCFCFCSAALIITVCDIENVQSLSGRHGSAAKKTNVVLVLTRGTQTRVTPCHIKTACGLIRWSQKQYTNDKQCCQCSWVHVFMGFKF